MLSKVWVFRLLLGAGVALGCGLLLWVIVHFGASEKSEPTLTETIKHLNWTDELAHSNTNFSNCNYLKDDLQTIITSAVKVLHFIESHVDDLIIDAVIGVRVLESQLNLFQFGHPHLPHSIQSTLRFIQLRCSRISERIIDEVIKDTTPQEKQKLLEHLYWVNSASLWASPGSWRSGDDEFPLNLTGNANVTVETLMAEAETIDERLTDKCAPELFHGCDVDDECAGVFLTKIRSMHSLTQQIFYFHFAEVKNCYNDPDFLRKMNGKSANEFVRQMCSKAWQEAHAIERASFPVAFRDLLLEKITACALAGYTPFLKVSWLKTMQSWQSKCGCFKVDATLDRNKGRVKRSDQSIQMGSEKCSTHMTSVALATLAMHMRYFSDTCLSKF